MPKARGAINEASIAALEEAATWITGADAAGWFEHAGYRLQSTLIISVFDRNERGEKVSDLCRELGISDATF